MPAFILFVKIKIVNFKTLKIQPKPPNQTSSLNISINIFGTISAGDNGTDVSTLFKINYSTQKRRILFPEKMKKYVQDRIRNCCQFLLPATSECLLSSFTSHVSRLASIPITSVIRRDDGRWKHKVSVSLALNLSDQISILHEWRLYQIKVSNDRKSTPHSIGSGLVRCSGSGPPSSHNRANSF